MGQNGPIALARIGPVMMPSAQGYIGTGGPMFQPMPRGIFAAARPALYPPMPSGNPALAHAPGKGGDTPGCGGIDPGSSVAVDTGWITDGTVNPPSAMHRPGTVGFVGSRRSGA